MRSRDLALTQRLEVLGEACFLASDVPASKRGLQRGAERLAAPLERSKLCVYCHDRACMWRPEDSFVFHQKESTSLVPESLVA